MQQPLWLIGCLSIKSSPLRFEPKNLIKANGYISSRKEKRKHYSLLVNIQTFYYRVLSLSLFLLHNATVSCGLCHSHYFYVQLSRLCTAQLQEAPLMQATMKSPWTCEVPNRRNYIWYPWPLLPLHTGLLVLETRILWPQI